MAYSVSDTITDDGAPDGRMLVSGSTVTPEMIDIPRMELDYLDQQILAALLLRPRASWKYIAGLVNTSESTVKRRADRLFASGTVRTTVSADMKGPGLHVIVQIVADLGRVGDVARSLAARPDARFVALVTGPFDIVAELVIPSHRSLATILVDELASIDGITHTTTETVVRNFKTAYDWSHPILASAKFPVPAADEGAPAGTTAYVFDDLDRSLLDTLKRNGRATFAELAASSQVTESLARRRVDQLFRRAGVRPIALVDPTLLGYQTELLVWLKMDPAQIETAAATLARSREVRYVSVTTGYTDLLCEVIVHSPEDSYDFVTHSLGTLQGVRDVNIASELITLKRAYLLLQPEETLDHVPTVRPAPYIQTNQHRSTTSQRSAGT